jgi:hypothetical protein
VRVTHPFHPLSGREFDFVYRRRNWDTDWVYFLDDDRTLGWIPSSWTDAVSPDPAVALGAGRSPFLVGDLLALVVLVRERPWR